MWNRLKYFLNPIDGRYEDLAADRWYLVVLRGTRIAAFIALSRQR